MKRFAKKAELEDKLENGQLQEMDNKPLTLEQLKSLEVNDWIWIALRATFPVTMDPSENKKYFPTGLKDCPYYDYCTTYVSKSGTSDKRFSTLDTYRNLSYSTYGKTWLAWKNKEAAETRLKELQEKR